MLSDAHWALSADPTGCRSRACRPPSAAAPPHRLRPQFDQHWLGERNSAQFGAPSASSLRSTRRRRAPRERPPRRSSCPRAATPELVESVRDVEERARERLRGDRAREPGNIMWRWPRRGVDVKTEGEMPTSRWAAMVGRHGSRRRAVAPRVGGRRAALGRGVALGPLTACTDDRVLVVEATRRWISFAGPSDAVDQLFGGDLGRPRAQPTRNEWPAWAPWIADHYDGLPEHLVLVSDSGPRCAVTTRAPPLRTGRAAIALSAPRATTRTTRRPNARGSRRRASSTARRAAAPSAGAPLEQIDRAFGLRRQRRRRAPTCSTPRAATSRSCPRRDPHAPACGVRRARRADRRGRRCAGARAWAASSAIFSAACRPPCAPGCGRRAARARRWRQPLAVVSKNASQIAR